jgi:pimeloyl-ACP methyl ester carboxylesterase
MARAAVGGISLEYEVSGAGDPVVLIHGALIADAFRPLFKEPSLTGYRLIAYHRRGYTGSSPTAGPISLEEQASDCGALTRHLGVRSAHVVGHSFGGAVALQLALDAPELVHSLALLEPALMVGASGAPYRASLEQAIRHFHERESSAAVDEMLQARWPGYRPGLESVLPGSFDAAVADASVAFDTELPGLFEWRFAEEEAKRIIQPVLSVLGAESGALSPRFAEAHQWLLATMPDAEGYVVPNAHHFLQVENPSGMAAALANFFNRHPLHD